MKRNPMDAVNNLVATQTADIRAERNALREQVKTLASGLIAWNKPTAENAVERHDSLMIARAALNQTKG